MEAIRNNELRMPYSVCTRIAGAIKRTPIRQLITAIGPGFVTSIGYIDPGNLAADMSGGSLVGYRLLWIIVACNFVAILVQILSARLGIYTGRSLPANCRKYYPKPVVFALWLVCELMAIATDIPSIVGAAIGFKLLFGTPMLAGSIAVTIYALIVLRRQSRCSKSLERSMLFFLLGIGLAVLVELFLINPRFATVSTLPAHGAVGGDLLAIGAAILGATVMPHLIIVQSSLAARQVRTIKHARLSMLLRFNMVDLISALSIACVINCAIVMIFAVSSNSAVDNFGQAYSWLASVGGQAAAVIFGVCLIASGLSSAAVGTLAGQIVMDDFISLKMSLPLRRVVVALPTLLAIGFGCDSIILIINSQIFLCFCLPFVLAPLIHLNRSKTTITNYRLPLPMGLLSSALALSVIAVNAGVLINSVKAIDLASVAGIVRFDRSSSQQ